MLGQALTSVGFACHNLLAMIVLGDRTIREELAAGRLIVDPLDGECL